MPLHTIVPYWGVLGMFFRLMCMIGIFVMWTWNRKALDIYDDALGIAYLQAGEV
jgi:hypothetical protein